MIEAEGGMQTFCERLIWPSNPSIVAVPTDMGSLDWQDGPVVENPYDWPRRFEIEIHYADFDLCNKGAAESIYLVTVSREGGSWNALAPACAPNFDDIVDAKIPHLEQFTPQESVEVFFDAGRTYVMTEPYPYGNNGVTVYTYTGSAFTKVCTLRPRPENF